MKTQFTLFKRKSGIFYVKDKTTGKHKSLRTKNHAEAQKLVQAHNDAVNQAIFNLHAVEGYTHVEIGKMLGINEGTSRSQYARARALLISWLERHSDSQKKSSYAR